MKEKDLKLAVSQYLEYGTNQGKWYADRLNSGSVLVKRGDKTYRVELCREGTADFMVIALKTFQFSHFIRSGEDAETTAWFPYCRIIFLELKGDKGKQRPEQGGFQKLVEAQGAEYYIIKSVDEVMEVLGEA